MRTSFTFEFHVNLVNGAFASLCCYPTSKIRNEKYVWCNKSLNPVCFKMFPYKKENILFHVRGYIETKGIEHLGEVFNQT